MYSHCIYLYCNIALWRLNLLIFSFLWNVHFITDQEETAVRMCIVKKLLLIWWCLTSIMLIFRIDKFPRYFFSAFWSWNVNWSHCSKEFFFEIINEICCRFYINQILKKGITLKKYLTSHLKRINLSFVTVWMSFCKKTNT